jgi:hypothetical protein
MPFWCKYMKVCLMKRNENQFKVMKRKENQFKASVKAVAASDANNSSVGCNEPFLREISRE